MSTHRRTLFHFVWPLLLVVPLAAPAADKPKAEGVLGGGKPTGAYLTPEQLRDCFAKRDKVKADDAELVPEQAAVRAEKDAVAREDDEMKAKLEAVDRTKAESVAAFNEAVAAHNHRIETFQTRAAAFNTRVEANEQAHAAYGQTCNNRRYFEEDAAALRKSSAPSAKP